MLQMGVAGWQIANNRVRLRTAGIGTRVDIDIALAVNMVRYLL